MSFRPRIQWTQQRDKIRHKLHYKATRSHFRNINFTRLRKTLARKPKYGQFIGSDTFSWLLETTGPNITAYQEVVASNDGHVYEIGIDYPSGSEYQFYIQMKFDEAIVFPSKLSQQLKGDHKHKVYRVHKPFQRGSRIKVEMVSDANLAANTEKACWVDMTLQYKTRHP